MASQDTDGANIFWPGYVDAISNLVLNLLFVVAILTIAVFLFATELGRRQVAGQQKLKGGETGKTVEIQTAKDIKTSEKLLIEIEQLRKQAGLLKEERDRALAQKKPVEEPPVRPQPNPKEQQLAEQVDVLNKQVAALKAEQAAREKIAARKPEPKPEPVVEPKPKSPAVLDETPAKVVAATEHISEPDKELKKIQTRGGGVVIVFANDAVNLSGTEAVKAKQALATVAGTGKARVEVLVPEGFSETRRLAYYRAMAVRNLLIEMGVPKDRIDVALPEVKTGGDSTRVSVR